MPEARNVTAIKKWVAENRPDMIDHIKDAIEHPSTAFILLMTTAFEAGRMFQSSEAADPARYVPMEELY